jgi:hypothetical protein
MKFKVPSAFKDWVVARGGPRHCHQKLGVHFQTVHTWLWGTRKPSRRHLAILRDVTRLRKSDLVWELEMVVTNA